MNSLHTYLERAWFEKLDNRPAVRDTLSENRHPSLAGGRAHPSHLAGGEQARRPQRPAVRARREIREIHRPLGCRVSYEYETCERARAIMEPVGLKCSSK